MDHFIVKANNTAKFVFLNENSLYYVVSLKVESVDDTCRGYDIYKYNKIENTSY